VSAPAPVAVLLVAGVGSRLRPLTDDRPKALVDVGGETLLGRAVRLLAEAGTRRLVVATGYRAEAVHAALASGPLPVTYCHNAAFDRTQNSVSLHLCAEAIGGEDFLKLDGDVLFRPEVLARLNASPAGVAAAVDRRAGLGAEEMKVLTEGDRITAFGKGLDPALSAGESIGIERVRGSVAPSLFRALGAAVAAGRVDLYYEDIYQELLAEGLDARAVDVTDLPWIEIDTPEDLEAARALARQLDLL
jgi:choline kinase